MQDIAITGISCMFPGAPGLEAYWDLLFYGRTALGDIPPDRWDWKAYFDDHPEAEDKIYSSAGGFIEPILFDPLKYGMPPSSLQSIEPMQMLALEAADAALRDAGCGADRDFPRERTSVFLGISGGLGELGQRYVVRSFLAGLDRTPGALQGLDLPVWTEDSFPGILLNVTAGRIANRLNLGGVNMALDAACASSMAAVWSGFREVAGGFSDMALVGGVDTFQSPFNYLCFAKTRALSEKGVCRPLDADADGTCISEGIGMLVLKRRDDAERDGDRIYAVIKSVGGSSDGRARGLTAPDVTGQLRSYRRAYDMAGLSPEDTGLVETHGTGTALGDRTELESLRRLYEEAGAAPASAAIGSVKSLIGHAKAAAGAAGLIKAALALYHRVLPGTAGITRPADALLDGPLYANTKTRPWFHAGPRRAAVSGFGFGGANFHAVLEEFPAHRAPASPRRRPNELFLWRRNTAADIRTALRMPADALDAGSSPAPAELARAIWNESRAYSGAMLAIVADSLSDLRKKIACAMNHLTDGAFPAEDGIYFAERAKREKLAFLFSGQGAQYPGMFSDGCLFAESVRSAVDDADAVCAAFGEPLLSSMLYPPPSFRPADAAARKKALADTRAAQPALGAVARGLTDMLAAYGIAPDMVAGHSYGEYPALYAAGAMTGNQLIRISRARGRCMAEAGEAGTGTMAAVSADAGRVADGIENLDSVWIANHNSPSQTVISGTAKGIEEAVGRLEAAGLTCRPVAVSCAFHTPLMEPASARFAEDLQALELVRPGIPVYSNTTAERHADDPDSIRAMLGRHLLSPVRFTEQLRNMFHDGARVFLEVGPKRILTGFVRELFDPPDVTCLAMDDPDRDDFSHALHILAALAVRGQPICLDPLFRHLESPDRTVRALLETARPETPPPSAWRVDGGSAIPLNQYNNKEEEPRMKEPPIQPPADPAAPEGLERIFEEHHRLMNRFLETHRAVMEAYLTGAPPAPSSALETALPTTAAAAATETEPASDIAPPETPAAVAAEAALLDIAAAKTGYPREMLDLDASMEADLGIDSIKRVEIIGAMRKQYAALKEHAGDAERRRLAAVKTLRDIVEWAESRLGSGIQAASAECPAAAPTPADGTEKAPAAELARYRLEWIPAPAREPVPSLLRGATVLITDEGNGLTRALCAELERLGCRPLRLIPGHTVEMIEPGQWTADFHSAESLREAVDWIHGNGHRIDGIIHTLPMSINSNPLELSAEDWRCAMALSVKSFFYLAQALESDLRRASLEKSAFLTTLSPWHETFEQAANGGLEGFLNTVCLEWPNAICKAIEIPLAMDADIAAKCIVDEIPRDDGAVPVVRTETRRLIRGIAECPVDPIAPDEPLFSPDDVILITGGARGITAQAARAMARHGKPHIILAGRSPLPSDDEPDDTRALTDSAALRRALAARLRAQGAEPVLRDVETAYRSLCAAREIRETLESIQSAGSPVTYIPCDVRDAEAFEQMIEHVRETWGRLDGLIHGAGCIEDKKIEEKSPDAFDRVFDTKADSGRAIVQACNGASPRFIVLYSSIAMCGNIGQSDYAAANGVLDRLALYMNTIWPHTRTTALLWGPWRAGMVTDELARQFEERGVQVIPPDLGVQAFLCEIRRGGKSDVEVVLGDGPWRDGQASTRETTDPCADIYSDERTAITTAT